LFNNLIITGNQFTPMPNTLCRLYRLKNSYFLAVYLFCFSLGITNPAQAEYKKPKNQAGNDAPNSQTTSIAATRGVCSPAADRPEQKANSATLTTLAPYSHVGQSNAINPTFTWYIPDQESYPMEFWLYEFDPTSYDSKGRQVYQAKLPSSAGIMSHSLPTKQISLTPGKTYIWQVALICNPNSPSQSLVVNNQVEIVEVDPTLKTQLNNSSDYLTKADIYAQAGLWYDALAEVATMPNDPQAQDLTLKLISQLAQTEQANSITPSAENAKETQLIETHQQNLRRVIEALQLNSKS
jgi:hypothetical protein